MSAPLDAFITNIHLDADGVWRPLSHSAVSYPSQGHDTCIAVEDTSFWFSHRNRCIAAAISRHPPPARLPFADIGGGNGIVAAMLRKLGLRVILIEPGATGISHARARGIQELVESSIVDLQVTTGSLGAIGLFDVLEHIENDTEALLRLRKMLAEGGKIYATVPAHQWLWSSADDKAGHYRRYTVRQLKGLFKRCNFEVELCSYFFWPLPLPMFVLRCLPERLRISSSHTIHKERVHSEHDKRSRLLDRMLLLEERSLRQGNTIPIGASCIIVARKPTGL